MLHNNNIIINNKEGVGIIGLQICPIKPPIEYIKEWNINHSDFVALTKNGELISNSLYRIGGINEIKELEEIKKDYFMLLKYVESIYDMDFIKQCYPNKSIKELELRRKHLEGLWCIIDKNGIEKKIFKRFESPYLVKDSCIYSIDNNYYNIETGEFYCKSSQSMGSKEYLFIENKYDENLSKKGVMKINKKDGSWYVFS